MRVAVIGAGYVGLVSGLVLWENGHDVVFVDEDAERCRRLALGAVPFVEPGLGELLARANASGGVRFVSEIDAALACELALVCVPTPTAADGRSDLDTLFRVADDLGRACTSTPHALVGVVVRSTCVPGTAAAFEKRLNDPRRDDRPRIDVAAFPEFLREGSALADHRAPDRFVLGTRSEALRALVRRLYSPLGAPILETTPETAELVKLTSNAWLSTCVSFSNEIARIAESVEGVDADVVFEGVHLDRRLSLPTRAGITEYLRPGAGFGGSCLGKDLRALATFARDCGEAPSVLDAVGHVNDEQPRRLVRRLAAVLGDLQHRRVLVLGLAFKAGTDDVRGTVALPIVEQLVELGAHVTLHDALAGDSFVRALSDELRRSVALVPDWPRAAARSDAVVLLTRDPSYEDALRALLRDAERPLVFVDGRSVLRDAARSPAVTYLGVGLGPSSESRS